jgi:hypothetical protein
VSVLEELRLVKENYAEKSRSYLLEILELQLSQQRQEEGEGTCRKHSLIPLTLNRLRRRHKKPLYSRSSTALHWLCDETTDSLTSCTYGGVKISHPSRNLVHNLAAFADIDVGLVALYMRRLGPDYRRD